MSSTGLQVSAAIANHYRRLVQRFKATGGTTTTAIDTTHLRGDTLPADYFGDAWIRFTTGNNAGYVGRIDQFSGLTGTITFSPAAGNVCAANDEFEVWRKVHPDDGFRARDIALTRKCKDPRLRPLTVLAYVEDWRTAAYNATTGGVTNATAAVQALDFPDEYQADALRVTNTGAAGYCSSEAFGVQPNQILRVFGWVRASAQTGSIRVRDLTAGSDITVDGTATFSLLGWQYIDFTFVVPSGCGSIQLWCGGANAAFVGDFCGIGLAPTWATELRLPASVLPDDVGRVFEHTGASLAATPLSADDPELVEIGVWRRKTGKRMAIAAPHRLAGARGVYVELNYHFAALQTDYLTVANRTTGDAASTTCPLEYVAAATVVELLVGAKDEELRAIWLQAEQELNAIEARLGPPPIAIPEPSLRPRFHRSRV